jgi:hypothetical protein
LGAFSEGANLFLEEIGEGRRRIPNGQRKAGFKPALLSPGGRIKN